MKEKITNVSIITIILMGFQIIIALLPYFGIVPLNKPTNMLGIVFKFLLYKVPIIWVIILITIFMSLLLKKRRGERYDNKNIIDKIPSNEVGIDLRSHADQIVFYLPHDGIPSLQIWFKIINKSSLNLVLDKLTWELGIDQFVKKGEKLLSETIDPKGENENVLIELNLSDSEAKLINNIDKNNIGVSYFKGKLSASLNGYSCAKEFNLNEIKFRTVGGEKYEEELTEEQCWILSTLLNKTNQDEYKNNLEEGYIKFFNKNVASFNILRKELVVDKKLIIELKSYNGKVWKLTNEGVGIVAKKIKK